MAVRGCFDSWFFHHQAGGEINLTANRFNR